MSETCSSVRDRLVAAVFRHRALRRALDTARID